MGDVLDGGFDGCNQCFDPRFCTIGNTAGARGFVPVPASHKVQFPAAVLALHGHGELCVSWVELIGSSTEDGIHRQHVVDGRKAEASTGFQMNTEILGMAVGCGQHPEEKLRLEEDRAILGVFGLSK